MNARGEGGTDGVLGRCVVELNQKRSSGAHSHIVTRGDERGASEVHRRRVELEDGG